MKMPTPTRTFSPRSPSDPGVSGSTGETFGQNPLNTLGSHKEVGSPKDNIPDLAKQVKDLSDRINSLEDTKSAVGITTDTQPKPSILKRIKSALTKVATFMEKTSQSIVDFGKKNKFMGLTLGLGLLAGGLALSPVGAGAGSVIGIPMAAAGLLMLVGSVPKVWVDMKSTATASSNNSHNPSHGVA
jgi:hypothetical protein